MDKRSPDYRSLRQGPERMRTSVARLSNSSWVYWPIWHSAKWPWPNRRPHLAWVRFTVHCTMPAAHHWRLLLTALTDSSYLHPFQRDHLRLLGSMLNPAVRWPLHRPDRRNRCRFAPQRTILF